MQVEDFDTFYEELHGRTPLPWQHDLVLEILERGSWPTTIDVPTGLGKTSMLDIAVFLTALDGGAGMHGVGRRRIFFVVDRKIVVDQAETHARHIAQRLHTAAPGTVLGEVVARLRGLGGPLGSDEVLPVRKMRGGVTWDASWLERPDVAGIVTGTVDQIGSRLFFRGYGVTPRRWPIDAALTGTDSLILIDEAHVAVALATSLDAATSYDDLSTDLGLRPPAVVQMSATTLPTSSGWQPAFDESKHLAHPVAAQRLLAGKSLQLRAVKKSAAVKEIALTAARLAEKAGSRVLAVCNTVDRAREVYTELGKQCLDTDLSLLIGRSRSLDRDEVVAHALTLFGADREVSETRAILVATQTVEVGADFDATALVTESASWDALVQRIGRVNRRGACDGAQIIVVHDDDPKAPVYGQSRERAVAFLQERGEGPIDVSPLALRRLGAPIEAFAAPPVVPLLLPRHLDAWTRTSPTPANDAPLDPYLHGIDNGVAPVTLAWRDGLVLPDGSAVGTPEARWVADAIPVRAEETVEVPLGAARRWLMDEKPMPVDDWDDDDDWDVPFGENSPKRVLRRAIAADGSTDWVWADAQDLRPADLVVVPSEFGGLDRHGWAPRSQTRVSDLSELAAWRRGRPTLRLDRNLPVRLGLRPLSDEFWERVRHWTVADDPNDAAALAKDILERVHRWLEAADAVGDGPWRASDYAELAEELRKESSLHRSVGPGGESPGLEVVTKGTGAVVRGRRRAAWQEVSEESEAGTAIVQRQVSLTEHSEAVGQRAHEIALNLGLRDHLVAALTDAARWHDLGKVDPRFQAMLFGGDAIAATISAEPLAKSGMPPGDQQVFRLARRRSGLPQGARHEVWSEALVAAYLNSNTSRHSDHRDLLLHLVASHHGYARPFPKVVLDTAEHRLTVGIEDEHITVDLPRVVDVSAADRFDRLNQRYGRWGLALLETIVRCADIMISREGS